MITAEHVSDRRRGLAERSVIGQLILIHCVKDSAVDRLQSVADVGKRTRHDDAHRIFDERFLHALSHFHVDYFLIFIRYVSVFHEF